VRQLYRTLFHLIVDPSNCLTVLDTDSSRYYSRRHQSLLIHPETNGMMKFFLLCCIVSNEHATLWENRRGPHCDTKHHTFKALHGSIFNVKYKVTFCPAKLCKSWTANKQAHWKSINTMMARITNRLNYLTEALLQQINQKTFVINSICRHTVTDESCDSNG